MAEEAGKHTVIINNIINKIGETSEKPEIGVALHRVIVDDLGKPADFEFIFSNKNFEKLINCPQNILGGKKISEVFPEIKQSKFNWIEVLGQIGLNYGKAKFYYFSEKLQKWFIISVCCPETGYFIIYLKNIPDLKSSENINHSDESIKWLIEEFK
jgi:hypothetical protein